ncbi:hypothetical protein [Dactylosporangium sp. CA-092794]|uniref:hypothetical protein n=1 Tax=Dactylosporangium sp. CA-092794 TaxID=3239929 RepID=UPI003D92BD56
MLLDLRADLRRRPGGELLDHGAGLRRRPGGELLDHGAGLRGRLLGSPAVAEAAITLVASAGPGGPRSPAQQPVHQERRPHQ